MDISTIGSAISATKTALDLLGVATQLRDDAKIKEALRALNDRIIEVQNSALNLQEKLSARQVNVRRSKTAATAGLSTIFTSFPKTCSSLRRTPHMSAPLQPTIFASPAWTTRRRR